MTPFANDHMGPKKNSQQFLHKHIKNFVSPNVRHNSDSGIREFFGCGIRNPGLWNPEYSSRNPEPKAWNPESKTVFGATLYKRQQHLCAIRNRPFYRCGGHIELKDLRSIMGCPGGTRSVFTRAFRANRVLQCIFLGKKAIIITSKHGTTMFFSHNNLFLGKLKEKLARKARVNTDASISDRAHAPWASHSTS